MKEQSFHVGVKALIVNEKNELLLLKINPDELVGDKRTYWDLPGGRIRGEDSIERTLRNEVEEELGVNDIKILEHFDTHVSNISIPVGNGSVKLLLIVYKCKMLEKNFKLSFEHTDWKWVPIEEAKQLLKIKFPDSFIRKLETIKN